MAASEDVKKRNSAEVQVPGSTSNLGPGFELLWTGA